jgi:hypothetical protein
MSQSESFDPHAVPEQYELLAKTAFLANDGQYGDVSDAVSFGHWQEHLLPISCITQEDNLTVLRVELETAHQLLQHQQNVIDSLTEQLTNRELHLQHTQDKLAMVQQVCEGHTANMIEVEAVCRDLKTQLRRQQQRVLQYRSLLSEQMSTPATLPSRFAKTASKGTFGCQPVAPKDKAPPLALKPSPVSAWSAPESIGLTGPLARYRKLATIRMASPRRRLDLVSERLSWTDSELTVKACTVSSHPLESAEAATPSGIHQVDLPSFTRSVSH